jgi:hypothetical protein
MDLTKTCFNFKQSCISVEACCNPRTCQFYSGAECLSGACCSGCKLLPSDYPCRASRNTCDVPEFCDGISAQVFWTYYR